ncbi:hypothetical protein JG551_000097 [Curtobacterium flaccumfaciens pv. flaccumfaciens]|uniref:hypothetical protein n=1 Tax=Curtobacterium flaccumfaciens TaxID=2035 RepID=UPI001BCAA712|nr:hypothetical protein [Curtobacterium flaccumfaciens]QVG66226.1 hypothetical protein JG551_000097 [Curtobacterium flaccumfaciens pv. flaccumfaciens]
MATIETTAYAASVRTDVPKLVTELRDVLGAQLVAYIAGVKETRAVRQWADGEGRRPQPRQEQRLRLAFRVAALLLDHDSPRVVQSWFQGMNPQLDDVAPARFILESDGADPRVIAAAHAFAANG